MKKLTSTILLMLVLLLTFGTVTATLAQNNGGVVAYITTEGSVRTGEMATVTVGLENPQGRPMCSVANVSFTIPADVQLKSGELIQMFETIHPGESRQASIVLGAQFASQVPQSNPTQGGGNTGIVVIEGSITPSQDSMGTVENNIAPPQTGDSTKTAVIVAAVAIVCAVVALVIVHTFCGKVTERVFMILMVSVFAFGAIGYAAPTFAENEISAGSITLETTVFGDNGAEYKVQAQVDWTMKFEPINILVVGSGLIARDGEGVEHDTRLFLQSICEDAGIPVNIESIVIPSNYNLYEAGLTGESQSKVKDALESKKFDYVVLQMGRDYVLTLETTKEKDLAAIKNIEKYLMDTNPDGKLVFFVPPYRNDMGSKYWESYSYRKGWSTIADHAAGIRAYMAEVAGQLQQTPIYADVLSAFEEKLVQGINVFHETEVDFPSVDGSFVAAVKMFEAIFGESAYGLGGMTVADENGKEYTISNYLAKLYGLASGDGEEIDPNTVSILMVGTDLIARSGRNSTHDSRLFLQTMCEDANIPVYMESIIKSTNYNVYESGLTGTNQSRVNAALNNHKFDFVVVQMGKDYVLTDPSKAEAELIALRNIEQYLKDTNPDGKLVLIVPTYRNNMQTAYWTSFVIYNDWSTIQDHSVGIKAYVKKQADQLSQQPIIADVLSAFEEKLAQGIQVFHEDYNDYSSVDGSFITAATIFEALFNKSAYGYGSASVTTDADEVLSISNELASMYGITPASGAGRVSKYDWSHEVITQEVEALQVIAKAFYDRRYYVQYDQLSMERVNLTSHRGNSRAIPEDATAQKLLYTDCAYFVRMCYYNAFEYDFGAAFTTAGLVKLSDIRTFYWEKDDGNVEQAAQNLLQVLQPGDLIAYRNAANTNGHVLLYIGSGKLLHSTGFGGIDYNYTRKADNFEPGGTLIYSTMDELLNKNDPQYLFADKSVLVVLRPLMEDLTITENTKARVAGLQNIVVSKTTSHPDGVTANPGDTVTFTIEIKNNNNTVKSVQITEVVPAGMTYNGTSGAGSTLHWDMEIDAGETMQFSYSFVVNNDVEYDTMISCANTKVNGVQINDCPVYVMKTLSVEQQNSIVAAAQTVTSAENSLDFAKQAYANAFNYALPIDNTEAIFTEVFNTPSGGCVKPTQSGGEIRSMMVETIYGGQNTKTESALLGVRTSNPTTVNMVAGDILVFFTGDSADTGEIYLYLGNDKLVSVKNGEIVAYDTVLRSQAVTVSLLGQYAFCLLRPSAVMP